MAKKVLSKLQQEFYDLVIEGAEEDIKALLDDSDWSSWEKYCEALKKDISGMNAAELRRNIKLWKEDISFGRK